MKSQYYTASSINGFIADTKHSLDWLFQFEQAEGLENHYPKFFKHVGAMCMGSSTYEWLLKHEDYLTHPEKWPYTIPVWVFSHRHLPKIPEANVHYVKGDVSSHYADMVKAAGEKNLWLAGGGDLVGQFYDRGFLDEIIISIASVMLEGGSPLLPRQIVNPPLKLSQIEKFGESFAVLTYTVQKK